MVSDGQTTKTTLPQRPGLLETDSFRVEGATWVIVHDGQKVSHIYLWMAASEAAETILETVRQITAGQLTQSV